MAQKTSDITSKRIVSLAPEEWVRWGTNIEDATNCEVLNTEFQLVSRQTDALVRVKTSSVGEFLVLFEFQTRYTLDMPERMHAYTALAKAKFSLPVYPILINILPYGKEIPHCDSSEFLGIKSLPRIPRH